MVKRTAKMRASSREKFSLIWKIGIIAALIGISLWKVIPALHYYMISAEEKVKMDPITLEKLRDKALNLGLDLQGGIHLVMEVDTSGMESKEAKDAVDRAVTVVENRVNQFGLTEPVVQKQGENRIIVELAGMQDVDRAKKLIGRTARLEFKLLKGDEDIKFVTDKINLFLSGMKDSTAVSDSANTGLFEEKPTTGEGTKKFTDLLKYQQTGGTPSFDMLVDKDNIIQVDAYLNDAGVQAILENARVVLLWGPEHARSDDFRDLYLLNASDEMTGEMIKNAQVALGSGIDAGKPEIQMENTSEGVREWARITGANIGKRLAIVLDSTVYSAPTIKDKIYGGTSRISGSFTTDEARDLAIVLRAGALPATVTIIEDRTVGPSLGADSIKKSEMSLIIGLAAVTVFMVLYYMGAGLIAVFALILDALFILAYLAFFHATLTLPGMAGIILTLGMAVDANVLIYERIREELRLGNTTRVAVDIGFSRATVTILDSNITTFLTAIILYNFGTGPIKGFALTLMVGLVVSVFTAVVVSRVIFDIMTHKLNLSKVSLGFLHVFLNTKFPFIQFRKIAYFFSGIMFIVGIVSIISHSGLRYSIDFIGGNLLELHFDKVVDIQTVRKSLENVKVPGTDLGTSEIKYLGRDKKDILIRIVKSGNMAETSTKVKEALKNDLKDSLPADMSHWVLREEAVGPSVGAELKKQALWSIFLSFIVLLIYITIRFDFKFALGAIISLIHDPFMIVGVFSLMNKEISLTVIASILTIIGYSINDTIVVYDRIREKLRKGIQEGYIATLDKAINETLSRTTITSFLTFLTVLAIFLFGGTVIHDFSFALIIGIVVGTYSSIYVATPVVAEWYLHITQKKMK